MLNNIVGLDEGVILQVFPESPQLILFAADLRAPLEGLKVVQRSLKLLLFPKTFQPTSHPPYSYSTHVSDSGW